MREILIFVIVQTITGMSIGQEFRNTTIVSYYGDAFHGKQTACLDTFDMYDLTAASPCLPCGTKVKITNMSNCKSVVVLINDRGPFKMDIGGSVFRPLEPHPYRGFDLSKAAFDRLGDLDEGLLEINWEIIKN